MTHRLAGLLVLVTAAACGGGASSAPTVATVVPVRGPVSITDGRDGAATRAHAERRVAAGGTVDAGDGARAILHHDGGAFLLLDGASAVAYLDAEVLRLTRGRLWVDATPAGALTVILPHGRVTVAEAAASVAVDPSSGAADVYVATGEVFYRGPAGEGQVARGEALHLGKDAAEAVPADLWTDWTGGLADPTPPVAVDGDRVGVLTGRPAGALGQARTPLALRSHRISVDLEGDLVRTELVQRFFNARSDAQDTSWSLRLPEGAVLQRVAVDLGGGFVDAEVGVVDLADPDDAAARGHRGALLHFAPPTTSVRRVVWDGPNRLRVQLSPVAPGQLVGIRVETTGWLPRQGDRRRLVVPLAPGDGAPPAIGELGVTVDLAGAGPLAGVRASAGAEVDGTTVRLKRSDARPTADLYVDLVDARPPPGDIARAQVVRGPAPVRGGDDVGRDDDGDAAFVHLAIPTEGLATDAGLATAGAADADGSPPGPDLVLLVDGSAGTDPADLELAQAVVATLLRQLGDDRQVAVRVADVAARPLPSTPEAFAPVSEELVQDVVEALAVQRPAGGTDLGRVFGEAAALAATRPDAVVVYVGDGTPTTGALTAEALRRQLAMLPNGVRLFGVAVGPDARVRLLTDLLGEDAVRRVADRASGTRAALELLGEIARPTFTAVQLELGETAERILPGARLVHVPAGDVLRVVARLRGALPSTVAVAARTRDGGTVRRAFQVADIPPGGAAADIPRRWAARRMDHLVADGAGREAIAALGVRFGLLSPWTGWTVGGGRGGGYVPVRFVDPDPRDVLGPESATEVILGDAGDGWRRRARGATTQVAPPAIGLEATWPARPRSAPAGPVAGDGGIATAGVRGALDRGDAGPRSCFERARTIDGAFRGSVQVEVTVDGRGVVTGVRALSGVDDRPGVTACVLAEVRGLPFPATGVPRTTVTHTFSFTDLEVVDARDDGCSVASREPLAVRRQVWRERLADEGGVSWAVRVWHDAGEACELRSWGARRALLSLMLAHAGSTGGQLSLYRALENDRAAADWLRRAILRRLQRPEDVAAARSVLGVDADVDWRVFGREWAADDDPEARLALVRRWLAVVPGDIDLRLRAVSLLFATGQDAEARTVARALQADPLADARVLGALGERWIAEGERDEAYRVLSEIVEHAPVDPAARRRLGDLFLVHGFTEDAIREYRTLVRLRPDAPEAVLLLARALARGGRLDEALRLAADLAEGAEPGDGATVAAAAQLWSTVQLARAAVAHADDPVRARRLAARRRKDGVLRDPPDVLVALTWAHPDDAPELGFRFGDDEDDGFDDADLGGATVGLRAVRLRDRPDGETLHLEVDRGDPEGTAAPRDRPLTGTLLVVARPFTRTEAIRVAEVVLPPGDRRATYVLSPDDALDSRE